MYMGREGPVPRGRNDESRIKKSRINGAEGSPHLHLPPGGRAGEGWPFFPVNS